MVEYYLPLIVQGMVFNSPFSQIIFYTCITMKSFSYLESSFLTRPLVKGKDPEYESAMKLKTNARQFRAKMKSNPKLPRVHVEFAL